MFDEATSALDHENEKKMQKLLNLLMEGKSTLEISHKLDSVKNSNFIMMMDDGKIMEKGTYNELLSKKGYFYNLHRGQDIIKREKIS